MIRRLIPVAASAMLVLCTSAATARTSLEELNGKLDQVLANQATLQADVDLIKRGLGIGLATCDQLLFEGTVFGQPARGIDFRRYTNSTLHFIGCHGDGCIASSFFCDNDPLAATLNFGITTSSGGALRALVDPGNAAGEDMSGVGGQCSSSTVPTGISNAPDTDADAAALCRALGYETGTVEAINSNNCPKPTALDADGSQWTSDFNRVNGYGMVFHCTGVGGR